KQMLGGNVSEADLSSTRTQRDTVTADAQVASDQARMPSMWPLPMSIAPRLTCTMPRLSSIRSEPNWNSANSICSARSSAHRNSAQENVELPLAYAGIRFVERRP